MSRALEGEHLCLKHQGNHSHYASLRYYEETLIPDLQQQLSAIAKHKRQNDA